MSTKGGPDPSEAFAFAVVGKVLDVEVEHHDTDGRQSAVDGLFTYPNGEEAALEVSSLGPQEEARIDAALRKSGRKREIEGLSKRWYVIVPKSFAPRDLPKIDAALLRCEALGIDSLQHASWQDDEPELDELFEADVAAGVVDAPGAEPLAHVSVDGVGGLLEHGLDPLPTELMAELDTPLMQSKIQKLAQAGPSERHLFLFVRPSAFSFSVYDGLAFGGPLPSETLLLPQGLTHVWLTTGFANGGVIVGTKDEWIRHEPFDRKDEG